MSEAGRPGQGARTIDPHRSSQLEFTSLWMEIPDTRAQVCVSRGNGWTVTLFTDVDPPTGALRDVEDNVRWILSRCAA